MASYPFLQVTLLYTFLLTDPLCALGMKGIFLGPYLNSTPSFLLRQVVYLGYILEVANLLPRQELEGRKWWDGVD